jgi:hypothetical protein
MFGVQAEACGRDIGSENKCKRRDAEGAEMTPMEDERGESGREGEGETKRHDFLLGVFLGVLGVSALAFAVGNESASSSRMEVDITD